MKSQITGVILAGGRGSRLGHQDKGLVDVGGKPLIEYVLERFMPQVNRVLINANRNLSTYRHYDHQMVGDGNENYDGPLAGMGAALEVTETPWLLVVPCDCPQIPWDLGARLYQQAVDRQVLIAVAHDGEWLQPVFSLLHRQTIPALRRFLEEKRHKIDHFYQEVGFTAVDFSDNTTGFLNLNTPEDIIKFTTGVAL